MQGRTQLLLGVDDCEPEALLSLRFRLVVVEVTALLLPGICILELGAHHNCYSLRGEQSCLFFES